MNATRRTVLAATPAIALAGCAGTVASVTAVAAAISTDVATLTADWQTAKGIAFIVLAAMAIAVPGGSAVAAVITAIIAATDPVVTALATVVTTTTETATAIAAQTLALTRAAAPLVTVIPNGKTA